MLKALSAATTSIPILQSGEMDAVVAYGLEQHRINFLTYIEKGLVA